MKIESAQPSVTLPDIERQSTDVVTPDSLSEAPTLPAVVVSTVRPRPAPFTPRGRAIALALIGLFGFLFLIRVSGMLSPFLWAIVFAYAFSPLITWIVLHTGLPRSLVVVVVYLLGVGALASFLAVTIPRLNNEITELANALPSITGDLQARYFGSTGNTLDIAGFSVDVPQVAQQVANSLNSALNNFFGGAFTAILTSVERIAQLFLFLIVTFYLLLDAPKIKAYCVRGIPVQYREELLDLGHEVNRVLGQYVRAQLMLIVIMACASFLVLTIMGVRFALALAPIVGLLELFPIIGPFGAITLVTLIALFSPPNFGLSSSTSALLVALSFFTLRQIEDYAVIPNVVGHAVRLHPALILFAVAAGTSFGGALGLFVAVPVTGALKVLGTYLYQKLVPA
jgi:predicted PurR-regulated permease PerM